ncbi:endo-1,3(4)-beta-glucanase [Pyronema omphalodes]|nr:endo-1,3(4)-beta-glucanase [Pyronema omphalodes]
MAHNRRYVQPEAEHMNFHPIRQNIDDIMKPIATSAPSALFPRKDTHPVAKPPMPDSENGKPVQTNKFYANMMIGSRNNPVFTFPYEVWWSNQENVSWGLAFDHREPELRAYGPPEPPSGAIKWYVNPIYIRSLQIGAAEFNRGQSTMEMSNFAGQSVDTVFYADPAKSKTTGKMEVTLAQGMGFISARYTELTPVLDTSVFVRNMTQVNDFVGAALGATKYRITLENGAIWVLYAFADPGNQPLQLGVINNGRIGTDRLFSGLIQVAKLSKTTAGDPAVEAILDSAAGAWVKSVSVSASVAGDVGKYQFNYERKGVGYSELLMFALPHHLESFDSPTAGKVKSAYTLLSPTKGTQVAVVANQWTMIERALPISIGWLPVKEGAAATFSPAALNRISAVAKYEMQQDFSALSNLDNMYFSGKALAKFGLMCLSTSLVLNDVDLTRTCQVKLKAAFKRFAENTQQNRLVYENSWRGVLSEAVYKTGDPNSDFGSGFYNDHHFHYGYFIQTAAIIGFLEKRHFSTTNSWLKANQEWVNTLVRDTANPSAADPYFPVSRSFDWYHGHSWAKGLFESFDGKDEESSSEDYNFAYAMKLWGNVIGDAAMEARGNLMLGIMKRSMNSYMLLSPGNRNHPEGFVPGMITGILFENKVDRTTYFGNVVQYIHGIHMLPLTPISPYVRLNSFVRQEWDLYFKGRTGNIDDGWKGILYANYAMLDPKAAFKFFNDATFQNKWLDGGASRTWYLVFAGGLGGATI